MNVGKLHYPQAIEGAWQSLEENLVMFDCEPERLTQRQARSVTEVNCECP
jgi:hypothetical protein